MERLLSVSEVAALLGVSQPMIYRLLADADDPLPYVEVGTRSKRFREADIERWLAGRTKVGAAP